MNLDKFTGSGSTPSRRKFWDKVAESVMSSRKTQGRNASVDEREGQGTVINFPDQTPSAPQTGACCDDEGGCTITTESDCTDAGGTYQGNGTVCDPNPCIVCPPLDGSVNVHVAVTGIVMCTSCQPTGAESYIGHDGPDQGSHTSINSSYDVPWDVGIGGWRQNFTAFPDSSDPYWFKERWTSIDCTGSSGLDLLTATITLHCVDGVWEVTMVGAGGFTFFYGTGSGTVGSPVLNTITCDGSGSYAATSGQVVITWPA